MTAMAKVRWCLLLLAGAGCTPDGANCGSDTTGSNLADTTGTVDTAETADTSGSDSETADSAALPDCDASSSPTADAPCRLAYTVAKTNWWTTGSPPPYSNCVPRALAAYDQATLQRIVDDQLDPWDPSPIDLSEVDVDWETQAVIVTMHAITGGTPTGFTLDHMERFGSNAGRLVYTSWADTFTDSLDSNEWVIYAVDRHSYAWLEARVELRYEGS